MVGESQLILEGNSRKTTDMGGECDGKIFLTFNCQQFDIHIYYDKTMLGINGWNSEQMD